MELWTEYEGSTIVGAFPLKKLLLPEGRSAFFSTFNANGDPTVIRLIACHFDEDEILARWRGVQALGHPNILKLEQFGQFVLDETTVVYAVMERVDANLAEVITDQRLSVPEALQLASSLASAIDVLHAHGFVHEHVEPANIYAVGEVVKLRGDCIRETPEGAAGVEARKHDIHNLGVVLLEALEQRQSLDSSGQRVVLPAPFDRIVPNAINGTWTLAEIKSAIGVSDTSTTPAEPAKPSRAPEIAAPSVTVKPPSASAQPPTPTRPAAPAQPSATSSNVDTIRSRNGSFVPPSAPRGASPLMNNFGNSNGLPRTKTITVGTSAAVAVLLLFWMVWHFTHSSSSNPVAVAQSTSAADTVNQPVNAPAPNSAKPTTSTVKTPTHSAAPSATNSPAQWRVIAFTYNYRNQAEKKSATIAQNHPDLHPEVFTPSGKAPFLVAVGGWMSRDAAYALARTAGKWDLPRDSYAQNYTGKQR